MNPLDKDLFEAARAAMWNAYAPYSGFRVGAAVLTGEGKIFSGANVENASYGLSICAERVAIGRAVSEGSIDLERILIVTQAAEATPPCGACRQVWAEFAPTGEVTSMTLDAKKVRRWMTKELLPHAFGPDDLQR